MGNGMTVMFEEEQLQIQKICDRLHHDSNAVAILVINRDGQEIARAGQTEALDVTSLSSLFAGNVAATGGIAKLLEEKDFGKLVLEGERTTILQSQVQRAIVAVMFDNKRSSLGLVQLRVKRASDELSKVFDAITAKMALGGAMPLDDISDDDIDKLFND
jgi:predicted regulator of Ras-like GTPase activity (Roadblock/LC7/MglB family)